MTANPKPTKVSTEVENCVFCKRIANKEYDQHFADHVWFEPLNPVTKRHMLVVPIKHVANINEFSGKDVEQVGWALRFFTNDLDDYNIITSCGKNATQTIKHLHFHIIPRTKNDGLLLPWSAITQLIDKEVKEALEKQAVRHAVTLSSLDQQITSLKAELTTIARAYGGCEKCYGKGYATVWSLAELTKGAHLTHPLYTKAPPAIDQSLDRAKPVTDFLPKPDKLIAKKKK